MNPLRPLAPLALLATLPACPGFGDRLPPDAAVIDSLDDAAAPDVANVDAATDASPPDAADATPPTPTWTGEIEQLFVVHCSLCHGEMPVGGAPYSLRTYEEVTGHLEAILDRVVEKRDMPPGGGRVTDEERVRLTLWAADGAPL